MLGLQAKELAAAAAAAAAVIIAAGGGGGGGGGGGVRPIHYGSSFFFSGPLLGNWLVCASSYLCSSHRAVVIQGQVKRTVSRTSCYTCCS